MFNAQRTDGENDATFRRLHRVLTKLCVHVMHIPSKLYIHCHLPDRQSPIAGGAFSDIWRTKNREGTTVALKRLRVFQQSSNEERLKLFHVCSTPVCMRHSNRHRQQLLREAFIWRSLRHENVLPFLGIASNSKATSYGEELMTLKASLYLVSPWMENGTVREYIRTQAPSTAKLESLVSSSVWYFEMLTAYVLDSR
jgi:serine/threonine protein kinase